MELYNITFDDQPSMRRYIRNINPGALTNPIRTNITIIKIITGQNAIKLWARSGGSRAAQYVRKPGLTVSMVSEGLRCCK